MFQFPPNSHAVHRVRHSPIEGRQSRRNNDHLDISFSVEVIEALYEELLNKSIEIIQPLRNMPYGREFYIADPDGYIIAFLEAT